VAAEESGDAAAAHPELLMQRRMVELLIDSEKRYRDLIETTHDCIWETDALGRITYVNRAAEGLFGMPAGDLCGRCFFDFEAGDAEFANRRFLTRLRKMGEVRDYMAHIVNARGEDRWIGINARAIVDSRGEMRALRGTARDITEQHQSLQKAEHLALHDQLTDLRNRYALELRVNGCIGEGKPGALLVLDLDNFKYFNSAYGPRTGDQLIRAVGSALHNGLRDTGGELFRLGGDEFAVHLPEALRENAVEAAAKLLEAIGYYRFPAPDNSGVIKVSASIGIALYPFHGADLSALLASADIALYSAKDQGRNRYMLFDQDSASVRSTHQRMSRGRMLREVLDEDRIVLVSQPVVRLADQAVVHHEVLMRVRDRDGGLLEPGPFVDAAESMGVIQEFDLKVVRKLLDVLGARPRDERRRYFVNLSRRSISDPAWVREFLGLLSSTSVDVRQLAFEITETAAMAEVGVTLDFIRMVKERGCRFALDDFGSGFSSFYYLKRFDVDYLKIDGRFIKDLHQDPGNQIFVKALRDVGHSLAKQIIAEWVETVEAADLLNEMGIQYGQGYYFQAPRLMVSHAPGEVAQIAAER
jgi:diguanylate cyclase (GGDEF)-like protein/PAS domain S-box-containing protein